jgi:hypothetical protein
MTRVNQIMDGQDSWTRAGCPLLLANVQTSAVGIGDDPGDLDYEWMRFLDTGWLPLAACQRPGARCRSVREPG